MPKIVMMKGLPASGKSTRAKELVNGGSFIRVNRDLLREMLHNGRWSGKNEDMTILAEKAIAKQALYNGINVVVDDTNLNPSNEAMWRGIADECSAKFEVEELTTPFDECIRRDAERSASVGRDVIVGMALQWNLFPVPDKGIVLCDLDGTLCDIKHRLKYAKGEEKNWTKFFEGIPGDGLRTSTLNIIQQAYSRGHKIFFVSARPEDYRVATIDWLKENLPPDFVYSGLIMRRSHDKRDDVIVKQELYDKYFKRFKIEFVVDDRPSVIEMWRKNGLEVIDVGDGIPF